MSGDSPAMSQMTAMLMLGAWAADDAAADRKVREHKAAFGPTVTRLTPTALQAMTELLVEEWHKRYGDNDAEVSAKHRAAQHREVRPDRSVRPETPR